jgi:eukaryotic-like serine/threonine-protein kinase
VIAEDLARWRRLQELFEAAADLAPEQREPYLASACAGNDELRREVEALLRSDAEAGNFIEQAIWRGSDLLLAGEPDPLESLGKIGKYEILGRIGEGGFGVVYKGRDPVLQRWVAVKTCSSRDEKLRRRFFREGQIAAGLQHPNITTVHDLGVERGIPYLVQEFLDGEDLHHKIARQEGLGAWRRLDILAQVARGLDYAHRQGVLHRDVKPANVRVLPSGTVKIMDFGIAKLLHEVSDVTTRGLTLGTVGYLAPEQLRGEEVDRRTDVFSFGVLTYELLTYERPFRGSTFSEVSYRLLNEEPVALRDLAPAWSRAIAELASRCLAKDPRQRYESFEPILAVLDPEIEALRAQPAQPVQPVQPAMQPAMQPAARPPAGPVPALAEGTKGLAPEDGYAGGAGGAESVERAHAAHVLTGGGFGIAGGEAGSAAAGGGGPDVSGAERVPGPARDAGRRWPSWAAAGWVAAAVLALAALAFMGGRFTSRRPASTTSAAMPGQRSDHAPGADRSAGAEGSSGSRDSAAADRAAAESAGAERAAVPEAGSTGGAPESGRNGGVPAKAGGGAAERGHQGLPRPSGAPATSRAGPAGAAARRQPAPRGAAAASATAPAGTAVPPGAAGNPGPSETRRDTSSQAGAPELDAAPDGDRSGSGTALGVPGGEPGGAPGPMARGDLIPPGAPGTTPPRLLSRPEPQYPEKARRRQVEADVLLLALVDENGRVVRTIVKRTDDPGNLGFNEAATRAALRSAFNPATRDGLAGKMWTEMPFSFRLRSGGE